MDVTNSGGDLSGPNGVTQNGGAEGEKIEVKICWTYWTWVRRVTLYFTSTGFECHYWWQRVKRKVCNPPNGVDVEGC